MAGEGNRIAANILPRRAYIRIAPYIVHLKTCPNGIQIPHTHTHTNLPHTCMHVKPRPRRTQTARPLNQRLYRFVYTLRRLEAEHTSQQLPHAASSLARQRAPVTFTPQ
jgi:hypothetical protein